MVVVVIHLPVIVIVVMEAAEVAVEYLGALIIVVYTHFLGTTQYFDIVNIGSCNIYILFMQY